MNTVRAFVAGLAVVSTLLLSACGQKLSDESARDFVDAVDTAVEAHDVATINELLAPEFKGRFQLPQGAVSMTRDEMIDAVGEPAKPGENRVTSLTIAAVAIDAAANRATVTGTQDSKYTMDSHAMHVVDDNTYVVELRDGKLVLVSLESRMQSLSIDGTKIH